MAQARPLVGGFALSLAGGLCGLLLVPDAEPAMAAQSVEIRVAGTPVVHAPRFRDVRGHDVPEHGGESIDGRLQDPRWHDHAAALARAYLSAPLELRAGAETFKVSRAALGVEVDLGRLTALLVAAHDPRSVLRRLHEQVRAGHPLHLPMPAELQADKALPWIIRLKDAVDRPALDARIDVQRQAVVPSKPGVQLDTYGTLEAIDRALPFAESYVDASIHRVMAGQRAEVLETIEMGAVTGSFETPYKATRKSADRTHNLRIAARKIDGWVIPPGEVFDFNQVVGPRSESGGFRPAPVISEGELVDGLGGGTCQIASTLHGAAFFAGLPILTRQPHSRPSFYIKLGLDAAVAYDSLNFRFKNDFDFPLVIGMTVQDGMVRAELRGALRQRRVTFMRRIDGLRAFEERIVEDDRLPRGMRVLSQRGVPGFEVARIRVVEELGTRQARREHSRDVYPPTTQVWRVGTGTEIPPGFVLPENDAHSEYVADEYLSMTQGPDIQGFREVTRAGRTGSWGWMAREGLVPQTTR